MSLPSPARALYLNVSVEGIFALFHDALGSSRKSAVLLCPPFGWDDICSYRSRRDWADHLARRGHPTLRIDLPGSGDSAGLPTDPARLEAWTEAVSAAARWLQASTGAPRVVAVGIGLGGLLAYLAASERAPIDDLVLWAVPARGRTMVRELRAFSRLEVSSVFQPGDPEPPPLPEGALAANGYLLSADTVASLEAIDLTELSLPDTEHRRALLLGRNGPDVDERLRTTLQNAGVEVSVASGSGYDAMMREPQDARAPVEVFDTVSTWLAGPGGSVVLNSEAGREEGVQVSAAQELIVCVSDTEICETPVEVDQPDGHLLGILSQPLGARRDVCAVLLNAGPQRRTGPNRMWVEITRRWAARGVPSLRIDLAAIGDSDGDASRLAQDASLYAPEYVEQVGATLDMLEYRGLPSRFLVVGLCSGAYWSLHAALADERIAAICMLNPRALIWDEWTHGLRRVHDLRERLFRASTWRKIVHGDITLSRHLETARALLNGALRARDQTASSRSWRGAEENVLDGLLDTLRDRDQRALLLFTGREPLYADFTAEGRLERLDRWANLQLAIHGTSADTHTLTPVWLQQEVHELLDRVLEEELGRLPEGAKP
jgi:pimeloyl-ACP methyl ester carboxylesterase